jgi:alkylation response protein AidB-like acyl-CoA dehydrogenase
MYLPALARGEHIAAHSVTEPSGGSDIQDLKTAAERVDGGWRITGSKRCITCASAATLHVVYARTGPQSLSCFLVEAQTPGISVEPLASCGLVGCGLGAVRFDNVFVPGENMVGKPGAGGALFQGSIERERACIWGFVVGAMRRDLEQAVEYANSREIGGAPIASRQAVAHRIADMKVRLDTSRLLLYRAAEAKAAGQRIPLEAAAAKLYISESFVENSITLVRTFGGSGYLAETGVEQSVRDALGGLLFSGTNDIQRNIIAAYLGLKV